MPPLRPVLAPQPFVIVRDSPVSQHAALFLTAGKSVAAQSCQLDSKFSSNFNFTCTGTGTCCWAYDMAGQWQYLILWQGAVASQEPAPPVYEDEVLASWLLSAALAQLLHNFPLSGLVFSGG